MKAIYCCVKVDGVVILFGGGGDTRTLFCVIKLDNLELFELRCSGEQKTEICPRASAQEHSQYSPFNGSFADTCQMYMGL